MDINPADIIIHVINVVILFTILRFVLFKPVKNYLDKRSDGVKNDLDSAAKSKAEAETMRSEYEKKIADTEATSRKMYDDITSKAYDDSEKIVDEARTEAEKIKEKARTDADTEKKKKVGEMKDDIADLSVDIASKVLEREVTVDDNRKIIDGFFKKETDDQE